MVSCYIPFCDKQEFCFRNTVHNTPVPKKVRCLSFFQLHLYHREAPAADPPISPKSSTHTITEQSFALGLSLAPRNCFLGSQFTQPPAHWSFPERDLRFCLGPRTQYIVWKPCSSCLASPGPPAPGATYTTPVIYLQARGYS